MKKADKIATKIYIPIFTALILVIFSVIAVYTQIEQKDKNFIDSFELENKQVYQTVYGNSAEKIIADAKTQAIKFNTKISSRDKNSQIKKINEGENKKWIRCDERIINLVDKCIEVSRMSKSTFDITSGILMDLWKLGIKNVKFNDENVKEALKNIDYNYIKINHDVNRIKLDDKHSKIDLDCIKEGAVNDLIMDVYRKSDADGAIVSVGNTTSVYGAKPDNKCWKLSVKDRQPNKNEQVEFAFLKTTEGSLSTIMNEVSDSGNSSTVRNKIIDLRTGYPTNNNISSVTIYHKDAVIANCLGYVCGVLDKYESKEILDFYNAGAIFVYKDKKVSVTDNIKDNFVIINKEYNLIN